MIMLKSDLLPFYYFTLLSSQGEHKKKTHKNNKINFHRNKTNGIHKKKRNN